MGYSKIGKQKRVKSRSWRDICERDEFADGWFGICKLRG
jgi:hypothetical protein